MALLQALQDLLRPQIENMSRAPSGFIPEPKPIESYMSQPSMTRGVRQGNLTPLEQVPQMSVDPVAGVELPFSESQQPAMPQDTGVGSVYQGDFYGKQPQQEKPFEWYKMKSGGGKITPEDTPWYKDRELMTRLALGFNTMRLNPDQSLAATLGEELKDIRSTRVSNKTSTAVIQQLRAMGEKEAADIVEANPAVAKDVLQQIIQAKYARKASPTASGVQIDPQTGQMFQVVFDPSTQKNVRVNVEGATGETPSAAATREAQQQALIAGQKMASDRGAAVFARASSLGEQIGKLQRARDLVSQGAQTGVIRSLLPSFDAATAELRAIGNSLGIDIINSATFGALSEKELSLALSTGLDLSLSGEPLQKHIQDKINAQEKLYNQLMEDARQLSSGMTYNQYIQMRTSKRRESPIPVYGGGMTLPPDLRSQMSEDEVAAFNKLPADMQQKFISGQ